MVLSIKLWNKSVKELLSYNRTHKKKTSRHPKRDYYFMYRLHFKGGSCSSPLIWRGKDKIGVPFLWIILVLNNFCGFFFSNWRIKKRKIPTFSSNICLKFWWSINLPWGHERSHTKFGPDRFSRFDVYCIQTHIQTNRQTPRQAKYIYIVF